MAGVEAGATRGAPALRSTLLAVGALLCALGAWLYLPARPRLEDAPAPALRVVLIDASASCRAPRPRWTAAALRFLEEQTTAARAAGEELAVLRVARQVEPLFHAGDPEVFQRALFASGGEPLPLAPAPLDGLGSDLAAGLARALEALDEERREPGRVVLWSDGAWTGADPGALLERIAAGGHAFERQALAPALAPRVSVDALRAPGRLAEDEPFASVARITWFPGADGEFGEARLVETIDGEPGEVSARALEPPAGLAPDVDGALRFEVRRTWPGLGAGHHRVGARVEHPADPVPEDDSITRRLRVGDAPTILVVARELARARDVARRVAPHLAGRVLEPVDLERLGPRLVDADGLWTLDLGPADLPASEIRALLDRGGGWFACGLDGLLRGFGRGPLAEVLPLELRPRAEGPRDVVLVVDGSGSMRGGPIARVRAAVGELIGGLPARDALELRLFQQVLGPAVVRARGDDPESLRDAVRDLLEATVPGGATGIPNTIDELIDVRRAAQRRALVVLVTDGHSGVASGRLTAGHRQRLAAARADLLVLTIGTEARPPDRDYLRPLLREGEELIDAGDLTALGELLVERIREESLRGPGLVLWAAAEEHPAGSLAREWIESAATSAEVGPLLERLDVIARPGADVLWRIDDRALLALDSVGLGRVAALGTSAGAAPEVFADPARFAGLLRGLTQVTDGEDALRAYGEDGALHLEGVPLDWPPLVRATLSLPVAGFDAGSPLPDLPLGELSLSQPVQLPAVDPRSTRVGPLPPLAVARPAGEVWRLGLQVAGQNPRRITLESPPVREHLPRPWTYPDDRAGTAWATAADPERGPHALAPWVLALGGALLVLAGCLPRVAGQGTVQVGR